MRSTTLLMLALLTVALASRAAAQPKDASDAEERERVDDPQERRRFAQRDREADNEQLGGEPSLTERSNDATPPVDRGPAAQPEEETPCDLDCIEAELAAEEAKEKQKKRVLEAGEQAGSLTPDLDDDVGDTAASEPSVTTLAEVATPDVEPRRLPARLGPVRLKVGQTDDWIGFGFATQLEFEHNQQFEGAGFPKGSDQTLQFRRIRLTLSSSFIDGRIRSRFQINLTPSEFELIDMWLAFTRFKFATVRIGQFKIPFDRYRAQSFAVLAFVDWPPTTRMFGSERQIGIETLARGGFLDLEYAFGVFTGVNARASHGVAITEVYGETPRNPSALGDGEVVREFHPELVGRVAKNFGQINTDTNSDIIGTRHLRHSLGAGFAWDARPNPIEDLAVRLSGEWLGKIRHFHINVISYVAWYPPWRGGKIRFGPLGVMGEIGYRFDVMWELAVRYALVYLTPWLRSDARDYGEFQIENASDPIAAILQYGANGAQMTDAELATAVTAHIIGNSLKVVFETAWENQVWESGLRNGLRINLLLQFLF